MAETRTFTLKVHSEKDHFWAEVIDLPGCFASGRDLTELQDALAEAIGMYLSSQTVTSMEIEPEPTQTVERFRARAELIPC